MDAQVFRSRIDPLLAGLVFIPLLGICGMMLQRASSRGQAVGNVTWWTIAITLAFVVWIFLSTSYRFTESLLVVRSGPFVFRVPLSAIRRVTHTRTVQSAPALSLQRLEIAYDKHSTVVISPRDEAGFLAMLKARAPDAQLPTSHV